MDLREALETALTYEKEVRDHYVDGAKTMTNREGRKVYATLAREEQEHVVFLERCLAEWADTGQIPQGRPERVIAEGRTWIERARKDLLTRGERRKADVREVELLRTALRLEERTAALYRELVGTLPAGERELFQPFLDAEEGHGLIVQAELDSVLGLGFWLGMPEFRNLGG